MKYLLLFISFVLSSINIMAQTSFTTDFGESEREIGRELLQTSDGGYILVGESSASPGVIGVSDIYLVKTDAQGVLEWEKFINNGFRVRGTAIDHTSDGGYIIAGWYYYNGNESNPDIILVKTNSTGDTLWTKTYGGPAYDIASSVKQTPDGGYIIVGQTTSFGNGNSDVYIIKTDAIGDTLWTRTYGGANYDIAEEVQVTPDGGSITVGFTGSTAFDGDMYVIKLDASGNEDWVTTIHDTLTEWAYSVDLTSDGGYIVAGTTQRQEGFWELEDIYWVKLNSSGNQLWNNRYTNTNQNYGQSVRATSDGGYIIGGQLNHISPYHYILIKTDNNGDTLWTEIISGDFGTSNLYSVIQTTDGGYAFTGLITFAITNSPGENMVLIKRDSLGQESFTAIETSSSGQGVYSNLLYPNPAIANQDIHIQGTTLNTTSIAWYDHLGRLVKTDWIEKGQQTIHADFSPGIYFYSISIDDGTEFHTGKLVILSE